MPRYRIFYAEHGPADDDSLTVAPEPTAFALSDNGDDAEEESEWEESYEAVNAEGALAGFFADHAPDSSNIARVEEDGNTSPVGGGFDPDRTYIWVEDGSLMEYQGIQEATPGTVSCPLCDGTGEVDEAVAEEYAESLGNDGA
jgi:hypothetical protein